MYYERGGVTVRNVKCAARGTMYVCGCRMEMQEAKKIADMKRREKMEEKLARFITKHRSIEGPLHKKFPLCMGYGVHCVFLKDEVCFLTGRR